ncbi:hypothetical protein M5W78_20825, partial [Paenibacillus larvae]|nr:hypothetical protein [Paenibacillus larvae]
NYTDSTALGASGAQSVGTLGFVAILFSILGIIGAAMSKAKTKACRNLYGGCWYWWVYFRINALHTICCASYHCWLHGTIQENR